jgi:hypothetical protein
MIWKEGMKVIVTRPCSGCVPGKVYNLEKRGRSLHELYAHNKEDPTSNDGGCSCQGNWGLVKDIIDWEQRTKRGDLL